MFNVGDRVRYKEESSKAGVHYNKGKAGLIGTIIKFEISPNEEYAIVEFDKEQSSSNRVKHLWGSKNGCYCDNLEYVSYKYDPSQAGDTDDDI